jgi:hypothetical protein
MRHRSFRFCLEQPERHELPDRFSAAWQIRLFAPPFIDVGKLRLLPAHADLSALTGSGRDWIFMTRFRSPSGGGIAEGRSHPAADDENRQALVNGWRAAFVKQLLTPAPLAASVTWKQAALARGKYLHTGLKPERLERAIADDLAFLAAHPIRHNNSEAAARRREFKEAMRRAPIASEAQPATRDD